MHYYYLFSKALSISYPHCAYVKTHGWVPGLQMRTSLRLASKKKKKNTHTHTHTHTHTQTHIYISTHKGLLMTSFNVLIKSLVDIVSPIWQLFPWLSFERCYQLDQQRSARHRDPVLDGLINAIASTMSYEGCGFWMA